MSQSRANHSVIKSMTMENWKSFRQATLSIEPFTVLIGLGSSGKTNLLEAFTFLSRTAQCKTIREAFDGDATSSPIRGGAIQSLYKPADQFTMQTLIHYNQDSYQYRLTVEPESYLLIKEQLIYMPSVSDETESEEQEESYTLIETNIDQDAPDISEYEDDLSQPTKGIASRIDKIVELSGLYTSLGRINERHPQEIQTISHLLQRIAVFDPVASAMRSPVPLANKICKDGSNIAGVIARLPSEQQQLVETTLSFYASHLLKGNVRRVWAKGIDKPAKHAVLYSKEQWHSSRQPILLEASAMADSTLRFLAILTILLIQPLGSLVAIENIDTNISVMQLSTFIHMIREVAQQRKITLIVTTQNPAVLDALEPELVPGVQVVYRDPSTGESKITFLEEREHLAKLMGMMSIERSVTRSAIARSLTQKKQKDTH